MALDRLDLLCPRCSAAVRIEETDAASGRVRCPQCQLAFAFRVEEPAAAPAAPAVDPEPDPLPTGELDIESPAEGDTRASGYGTDFHPKSLFDEAAWAGADAEGEVDSTASLPADAGAGWQDAAGWRRPPARAAFLLRIGAGPGSERLAIPWARTVVGRRDADLRLADATVSARHFEIESIGDEFFVRDLGSRNGTWLNGHRIRYAELRAGDALRAGRTELVFRTADDGFSRGVGIG